MKVCILDSTTKICVNAVMLNDPSEWVPVAGQEVANNHDGGIGWILTEEGWVDPTIPEHILTWNDIRVKRDIKLSQCDWTLLADSPLTLEKKQEWTTYRQALRDVPEVFSDPMQVVWPTPPV
jgi:hypothetical protein